MNWTCQYCNKDTSNVDYDYLVGTDHLSCILENVKMKTKLKITNPEKINTRNLCLDRSTISIKYCGHNHSVNDMQIPYSFYEFEAHKDYNSQITVFQIRTDIDSMGNVELDTYKGKKINISQIPVEIVKDRAALINKMIELVNEQIV
jgi:hypothetical protein